MFSLQPFNNQQRNVKPTVLFLVFFSRIKETYLRCRYNNERASAGTFRDDSQELGVDGTEVVVMNILGDWDAIEAVLSISYFSINISKLGASVGWTP